MKKIVIINNGLAGGGIERASTSMANAFKADGYDVYIIALYNREKFFSLAEGISFIEPDFKYSGKVDYVIRMILYMRRHIKNIRPDTILAFGEWTNSFVIIATRFLNIPVFLSDRMSPTLSLGRCQNLLKKIFYKQADGIIAQTEFAKQILKNKTHNKNIVVISNPVNIVNRISGIEPQNIIVTVGRLSKEKGHEILIKAFAEVDTNWRLIIVGDGDERCKLEKLTNDLGLSDKVQFVGHKKNIDYYLSQSKIFVLPSLSEGFPNALIEAMSLPLACISSNCIAGPSDIIVDRMNGLLVAPNNPKEMAEAISLLIQDKALREKLAMNARNVRRDLSFEIIKKKYLNFILQ